jgi:hypothetical protein
MNMRKLMLIIFIILLTGAQAGAATVVSWANAGSGLWSESAKWSPVQVPDSGDDVLINNSGAGTITVSTTAAAKTLTVGGAKTITLSTGKLTLGTMAAPSASALTKTVVFTSATAGISDLRPFGATAMREMLLYRAVEMKGAGAITSISFKYGELLATAVSCPSVTIKMGHTNLTGLAVDTTFAGNINTGQGSQQTVLNSSTVNIPAGISGAYFTIPLTTPYNYNGVDNLVVEISRPACTGDVHTSSSRDTSTDPSYNAENLNITNMAALTGELGPWLPDTRFNLSGGDSSVSYASPDGNSYPFVSASKMQLLYNAAEINGSGIITGIAFPVGASGSSATVTVRLGHTSLSALTNTFANNFYGTPVVAANARTITIPAGIPDGDYVWIPLPDGAFNYNGTDNLVVEIVTSNITGATWWKQTNGGTATRLLGEAGDTTAVPDASQYLMKFRFAGGPVDVITTGVAGGDTMPFASADTGSIRQILYLSSELGAKGTITKVAHRLNLADSVEGSYTSFTVKLANTDLTALGTTFATNMSGGSTVYSSTYSIPAGLKQGDWIEITLATPFVIDPTKNLLVEMSNSSGNNTNNTRVETNDTRYIARRAAGWDCSSASGSTANILADLRLIMQ